jgi:hypothetical protein
VRKRDIRSPLSSAPAEKAGRRKFWKQILPVTQIDYKGQKVSFDPKFHMDLAESFKAGAYDQVPLVFAGEQNNHNEDPRNFGGDIIDMEYRGPGKGQGTWALIEADKQAAREIRRNPKLGVSARIKQAVEKSDGRFFPRAVRHVLLTMNPRVQGMQPWQAVDLSDEDSAFEVVDLTAAEYKEGNAKVKTKNKGRRSQPPQIDLSALSDEDFNDLLIDLATEVKERGLDQDTDDDEDVDETAPPRRRKSRVKTTKVVERESEDDDDDPEDDLDAELSDEDDDADETFANDNERSQFQQMRWDLAEENWNRTRDRYLAEGVPAFFLDLAEPVLSQPDAVTIDLADDEDESLDVRETMTKMLDGLKAVVDLTGEIGTAIDLSDDEDRDGSESRADALLDAWDEYSA